MSSETDTSGERLGSLKTYDDAGRRTAKTSTGFDVEYANGTGDRLAGWVVTRTNTPDCMVAGMASETIGTDPRYGVREVSGGMQTVTPAVNGSNFNAQLAFVSFGAKTVVATVSDAAGNIGAATNSFLLAAYTAGDYLSDDAGCVTQIVYQGSEDRLERTLTWDAEYRLTAVATNSVAAEDYGYDPFGRRIWTAAAGVTNWHLYDGPHVLADLNATGGVIRTYLYGPGIDELIAMTVYTSTVAKTYYAIRDHQNTVWAWVDANGAVVESYDFDAWGRMLEVFDASGLPLTTHHSPLGNRYLWQGREYSWRTGLYYFRARWYDPVTGRWLSNDPIGISGGLNQYVFCGNNPVNFRDPFGLEDLDVAVIRGYIRGVEASMDMLIDAMAAGESDMFGFIQRWHRRTETLGLAGQGALNREKRPKYINEAIDKAERWRYVPGRVGLVMMGGFAGLGRLVAFQGLESAGREVTTAYLLQEWGIHMMGLAKLKELERQALLQQNNPYQKDDVCPTK